MKNLKKHPSKKVKNNPKSSSKNTPTQILKNNIICRSIIILITVLVSGVVFVRCCNQPQSELIDNTDGTDMSEQGSIDESDGLESSCHEGETLENGECAKDSKDDNSGADQSTASPAQPSAVEEFCRQVGKTSAGCIGMIIDGYTGSADQYYSKSNTHQQFIYYWEYRAAGKILSLGIADVAPMDINRLALPRACGDAVELAVEVDIPHTSENTYISVVPQAYADYINGSWVVKWEVDMKEWKFGKEVNANAGDVVVIRSSTDSNGYAHGKQYLTASSQRAIDQAMVKYERELNNYQYLYDTVYLPWLRSQ